MVLKTRTLAMALASITFVTSAYSLTPQAEADRLQLHAKAALAANDYATAVGDFSKLEDLHLKNMPQSLPYLYGVALAGTKDFSGAKAKLDEYLAIGSSAKFYREALEKYNEVTDALKKQEEIRVAAEEKYQGALRDYQRQHDARGGRVENCVQKLSDDYESRNSEIEDAHQEAQKCGSGWGNAIGMAAGGKDRCAPLWEHYEDLRNSYRSDHVSRWQYESDRREACERKYPEPQAPARP